MKRSSQVALLLMGVTSAGASSYALMPPRECVAPEKPAAMAPGAINSQALAPGSAPGAIDPQTLAPGAAPGVKPAPPCEPRRRSSWTSRTYWSTRSYDNRSTSTQPSSRRGLFSPSTSHTSVPSVPRSSGSRGGFGSTGHSVGSHSSGA